MTRFLHLLTSGCFLLSIGTSGLRAQESAEGWIDPEPPDAQARAEAVVDAEFNQNKRLPIEGHSTTLEAKALAIEGVRSLIEAEGTSLEYRLAGLDAEITDTEVKIRLSGSVLFDFNSTDIRPDAEPALGDVLKVLDAYSDHRVRIEGHTDSIDTEAYNQDLSERRAASVRDWLVAHGAEGGLMQTGGFGESEAVADNNTPEGRQLNRRVEIIIETGGS